MTLSETYFTGERHMTLVPLGIKSGQQINVICSRAFIALKNTWFLGHNRNF